MQIPKLMLGAALIWAAASAVAAPGLPWQQVASVPLGGSSPRFDYQTIDPTAHRLYVAHQGDGMVLGVDLIRRGVTARIGGAPHARRVRVAPALQRLYATATARHQLVTIDPRTKRIL